MRGVRACSYFSISNFQRARVYTERSARLYENRWPRLVFVVGHARKTVGGFTWQLGRAYNSCRETNSSKAPYKNTVNSSRIHTGTAEFMGDTSLYNIARDDLKRDSQRFFNTAGSRYCQDHVPDGGVT